MLNKPLKFISATVTRPVSGAPSKGTRHKRDYIVIIIIPTRIARFVFFFADDILATTPVLRIIIIIVINKYNI